MSWVANHEAGHAVAAVLTGIPLKYVTVVDTEKVAGHAAAEDVDRWWATPVWFSMGVMTAAGMAGEAAVSALRYPDLARLNRAWVAEGGGNGSRPIYDTSILRWMASILWTSVHNGEVTADQLGPEFNPTWADTPDGVRDIAAHCWQAAVHLMCEHAGTVAHVARRLARSKTLTGDQVAASVNNPRRDREHTDPNLIGTDFWLANYSQLVWRPYGMRRRTNRTAATPT